MTLDKGSHTTCNGGLDLTEVLQRVAEFGFSGLLYQLSHFCSFRDERHPRRQVMAWLGAWQNRGHRMPSIHVPTTSMMASNPGNSGRRTFAVQFIGQSECTVRPPIRIRCIAIPTDGLCQNVFKRHAFTQRDSTGCTWFCNTTLPFSKKSF